MKNLLIALDADGVLLDYNQALGAAWTAHCGEVLTVAEPRAYHGHHYWGRAFPDWEDPFWTHFDQHAWDTMPAKPGAVDACKRLVQAGARLVCVTSMPVHRQAARQANLHALGFPIDQVIASGSAHGSLANPKKAAIEELAPQWFVDDELRKLKDLTVPGLNCVLVDPGHPDSPNAGQARDHLAAVVPDLAAFADWFLQGRVSA